jgi:hypothetical protein
MLSATLSILTGSLGITSVPTKLGATALGGNGGDGVHFWRHPRLRSVTGQPTFWSQL